MRRRRIRATKGWVFSLGLLFVVSVVAGIPYAVASKDARRPAQEAVPVTLALPPGTSLTDLKQAQVDSVVDGDTIDVTLDGRKVRVRYFGVDTPERGDRCYREASDRNESLIGKRVLLLPDARETDTFGRSLRYVFLENGVSVDATLVAEGFGHAWQRDGQYKGEIIPLESQAQSSHRGCLWK